MENLRTQLDNFLQDVSANIEAAECEIDALAALRAITLDALLLEQRLIEHMKGKDHELPR